MSLWGCEELYVTGLHADVTDIECRNIFGTHGAVKEAVIVQKKGPSAPGAPQSCIVRMMNHLDAVKAKKALNKTDWNGKQISVKWSHNQRVLWVNNLHEAVTNEVLHAAFSQFGAVSKALVACDAPNNASRGWGFVAFENKRFAVKAIESCRERPFLVGPGVKPVMVDWARNEELVEGFSEDVRLTAHAKAPPTPPLEGAGHFPPPGSKEGMQAGRLLALRVEYEELRRMLKIRLAEAEAQLIMTGNAPPLGQMILADLGGRPGPGFMGGPPPPPPPGHMGGPGGPGGPRPPPGGPGGPGGYGQPPPPPGGPRDGPGGGPGGGGVKRELGDYRAVPPPGAGPPNKRPMMSHPSDQRYGGPRQEPPGMGGRPQPPPPPGPRDGPGGPKPPGGPEANRGPYASTYGPYAAQQQQQQAQPPPQQPQPQQSQYGMQPVQTSQPQQQAQQPTQYGMYAAAAQPQQQQPSAAQPQGMYGQQQQPAAQQPQQQAAAVGYAQPVAGQQPAAQQQQAYYAYYAQQAAQQQQPQQAQQQQQAYYGQAPAGAGQPVVLATYTVAAPQQAGGAAVVGQQQPQMYGMVGGGQQQQQPGAAGGVQQQMYAPQPGQGYYGAS